MLFFSPTNTKTIPRVLTTYAPSIFSSSVICPYMDARKYYNSFVENSTMSLPNIVIQGFLGFSFTKSLTHPLKSQTSLLPLLTSYTTRLPVFGFRVGNFAYITDVNHISKTEQAKLKNLDVLVLGALQRDQHISHFTLEEAVDMVELLRPKTAYFTHISHKMGRHSDVDKELPSHIGWPTTA